MSRIPSSAMPRARTKEASEEKQGGGGGAIKKQAGKIAEKARGNPKTAIAAGTVVAGALAAAAALPLLRRGKEKSGKKTGGENETQG